MTNSLTIVATVFSNTLIFLLQEWRSFCIAKATHMFSVKNINVFALFQDRYFNVTLVNNFVKFCLKVQSDCPGMVLIPGMHHENMPI